jgi:hypothetical protein
MNEEKFFLLAVITAPTGVLGQEAKLHVFDLAPDGLVTFGQFTLDSLRVTEPV